MLRRKELNAPFKAASDCGFRIADCELAFQIRNPQSTIRNGLRSFCSSRGVFAIEYAVLLVVAIAAFTGMSVYLMRALCGRWRLQADTFGQGRQYEPDVTTCTPGPC